MNYNQSASDRLRSMLHMPPALSQLIIINVVVWFILTLGQIGGFLSESASLRGDQQWFNNILPWIAVPASIPALMAHPWTIVTYMFVHEGFWHLFVNILWLFWFGKIFMQFMPGNKIYYLYLIGGVSGALMYILAYNFFPVFHDALYLSTNIGASASILAITVATAVLVPSYTVNLMFFGPVKIKYIAIFTLVLDVLMIRFDNPGGHFAHLGGAISGAVFIMFIRNNVGLNKSSAAFDFNSINPFRRKPMRKVYETRRPLTDDEYNKMKVEKQQQIDKILDKISRSGYTSLSAEEKEILFNSSKKS